MFFSWRHITDRTLLSVLRPCLQAEMRVRVSTLTGKKIDFDVSPDTTVVRSAHADEASIARVLAELPVTEEQIENQLGTALDLLPLARLEDEGARKVPVWVNGSIALMVPLPPAPSCVSAARLVEGALKRFDEMTLQELPMTDLAADSRLLVRETRREIPEDEDAAAALPDGGSFVIASSSGRSKPARVSAAAGAPTAAAPSAAAAPAGPLALRRAFFRSASGLSEGYPIYVLLLGGRYLMRLVVKGSFTIKQLRGLVKRKYARHLARSGRGAYGYGLPETLPEWTTFMDCNGNTFR